MKAIMRDERELKDSGIEWIGKIPRNWSIYRLKHVLKEPLQYGANAVGINYNEQLPRYVRITDISTDGSLKNSNMQSLPLDIAEPYILESGDVLFARSGATVGKAYIYHECDGLCAFAGYLIKAKCKSMLIAKMLYYYTMSSSYEIWKNGIFNQATIQNIGADKYCNLPLILIDDTIEQQAIVDYLDDRCSKIDAIIAEAKASIEEYNELKQAVIYEAVTKGLDKTVEMKDSGVEWVEKIPNNWHIVKITRILDKEHPYAIGDGDHGSIKTEQYRDSGIPFIRVQNLGWGTALNMDNVVYISEEDNKQIQNSTLRPNDILFAKTGATIGKTAIMPEKIPIANTTSHVGKISISKEHNSRYIFYVLSSQIGYRQFWDIAMQKTTRPELSIEETKSIKVVLPADKTIEDSIVNYLDEKIPVFDDMINTKASLIDDLESYKKSLIYEVVTGKRKVVA